MANSALTLARWERFTIVPLKSCCTKPSAERRVCTALDDFHAVMARLKDLTSHKPGSDAGVLAIDGHGPEHSRSGDRSFAPTTHDEFDHPAISGTNSFRLRLTYGMARPEVLTV